MTENGTLTCQNAKIKGTLYSENGKNKVYLRNGRLEITYNSQEIGLIGGNGFNGYSDKEGLNFDLEYMGGAAFFRHKLQYKMDVCKIEFCKHDGRRA